MPVKIRLFADDIIMYWQGSNPSYQHILNACLAELCHWCHTSQILLNPMRCVCMHITRKKAKLTYSYTLNSRVLDTVTSLNYLGVTITNDLRWSTRINNISRKTLKAICYLRRTISNRTIEVKLTAYKTYLRPIVEIADAAWDPFANTNIEQLRRVEKTCLRCIYGMYCQTDSVHKLYIRSGLPFFHLRRKNNRLMLMHALINKHLNLDTSK